MKHCKTCTWRVDGEEGFECKNREKIGERLHTHEADDALTYSYDEGGYFRPGPEFGCVHHEEKEGVVELTLALGDLVPGDTLEVTKGGVTVELAVQRKTVSGGD